MRKHRIGGVLIFVSIILCTVNGMAADATIAMDVNSAYVWRGITFNDGIVVQPSVDVAKGGFGFNVWGNIDMDDYDDTLDSGEFSEVDLTLSYGFDLDPASVSFGYIEYLFPAGGDGTREVYTTLGLTIYKGLGAELSFYYDIDEVEDLYVNFGLAYNIPVNDAFSLDLGASAGYAGEDASIGGEDGLSDYLLSISGTYSATKDLSISGSVNYTDSLDEDVLPDGAYAQDVNFFGGISVAYAF